MARIRFQLLLATVLLVAATLELAAQDRKPRPEPSAEPWAGAAISDWGGKVLVQLPGRALRTPSRGQTLPPGTLLDSGDGELLLRLEDESEILVRSHTRIVLKQPERGNWDYLQVLVGRIRAQIRHRTGGAPPFQLGTPSAVIAVRGTRFDVEVNRHQVTEVDVFSGLVEVGAVGIRGASVLVRPGFSTRVGPGGPPEAPVPTEQIRPDVAAPPENMEVEFARERQVDSDHLRQSELGERPDSEVEELENDAQEGLEGKGEHDTGKPPH